MTTEELITEYCKFNTISINKGNKEDITIDKIKNEISNNYNLTKYNSLNHPMINTTVFADVFTHRAMSSNPDFQPELAMIFIKSYIKQLLPEQMINPQKLVKVFNKNQELVEIPYSIVLYLGGLYYFQFSESERTKYLSSQTPSKLFPRINGLSDEPYSKSDMLRTPGDLHTLPSTKILNRSCYKPNEISTIFNIYGIENPTYIDNSGTMPAVGYGIQNNFLNHYNKRLFGTFLNGNTELQNEGKPHILAGGYSGILKPIKTYNSDDLEFTAFYRNLSVKNYTVNIDDLVNDLYKHTQNINKEKENDKLNGYIKSFIVYSKLKAAFLSGQYPDYKSLGKVIKMLNNTKNIKSRWDVNDFYFLVAHVFFTSFSNINDEANKGKSDNVTTHVFDLTYRTILNTNWAEFYQRKNLSNDYLYNTLSRCSTIDEQNKSLTDFLFFIWELEKNNMQSKYEKIDSKSVYALYPSAGGFISPNGLLASRGKDTNNTLQVKSTNKEEQIKTIYTSEYKNNVSKYLIEIEHNEKHFLEDICFNNVAILKNTSRFLWFDNTCYGNTLKLDLDSIKGSNGYDEVNIGFDSMTNINNNTNNNERYNYLNYFTDNITEVCSQDTLNNYLITEYDNYFKFNYLLDSLDCEKLEKFKEIFIEFSKLDTKNNPNLGSYTLKSLMLASSTIKYDDINDFTDPITEIRLTKDEINLALIGNSMFQYEFASKCGLSKYLNVALTKAQEIKANNIITEFTSNIITIANISSIGSINFGDAPQLSLHQFNTSPEILFSNDENYNGFIKTFGGESKPLRIYLSRRILFGNQYVPPFISLTDEDINVLDSLNWNFLINKLYTKGYEIEINIEELYRVIVIEFFKSINAKFNYDLYLQLLRLIRSYTYNCLIDANILQHDLLPSNNLLEYDNFKKIYKN